MNQKQEVISKTVTCFFREFPTCKNKLGKFRKSAFIQQTGLAFVNE